MRIGSEPTRRIELTYLNPVGSPEGGWRRFRVDAAVPGFAARFECETLPNCFEAFRAGVLAMHETLRGSATLEFTEQGVRVHGEMIDRLGHVLWQVELSDPVGYAATTLRFEIPEDQTMLRDIVAKIDELFEITGFNSRPD